ncbi:hypothetical protein Aduo_004004 [Ancylostoma duodenale]
MSNLDAAKEAMDSLLVPIEDYVDVVVDKNDRLGCIIKDCNGSKYVHCFRGFRGTEPMRKPIYEVGLPCRKDTNSTGYNVTGFAAEGLCTAPF